MYSPCQTDSWFNAKLTVALSPADMEAVMDLLTEDGQLASSDGLGLIVKNSNRTWHEERIA